MQRHPNRAGAALQIEGELWRYNLERSAVAEPFRSAARLEGLERTSLRTLAEHLIQLWVSPRPAPAAPAQARAGVGRGAGEGAGKPAAGFSWKSVGAPDGAT